MDYEIQNITIQLICKRSTKGLTFINDQNIIDLKDEILNEIEKKHLLHLKMIILKKYFLYI